MKHHKIRFSGFLLGVLKLKQQVPTAQSVSESSWVSTRFLCSAQQDKWQTSKINSGWSWCLGKDNVNCRSILSCFSQAMSLFWETVIISGWKVSTYTLNNNNNSNYYYFEWKRRYIYYGLQLFILKFMYTYDGLQLYFWNLCISGHTTSN